MKKEEFDIDVGYVVKSRKKITFLHFRLGILIYLQRIITMLVNKVQFSLEMKILANPSKYYVKDEKKTREALERRKEFEKDEKMEQDINYKEKYKSNFINLIKELHNQSSLVKINDLEISNIDYKIVPQFNNTTKQFSNVLLIHLSRGGIKNEQI